MKRLLTTQDNPAIIKKKMAFTRSMAKKKATKKEATQKENIAFPIRTLTGIENNSITGAFAPEVGDHFVCDSIDTFEQQLLHLVETADASNQESKIANVEIMYELIVANPKFDTAALLFASLQTLHKPIFMKEAPHLHKRYGAIIVDRLEPFIQMNQNIHYHKNGDASYTVLYFYKDGPSFIFIRTGRPYKPGLPKEE